MEASTKNIQLQYEGFLNTPLLWHNNSNFKVSQFELSKNKTAQFNFKNKPEIRLGKRVEQFFFNELFQDKSIKIIAENLQIQDGKRTVGELDCLLLKNNTAFHVEIVYKFYLYDATIGNSEIEHWIGPNRRDSFYQKLNKLIHKQLPLLQNKFTQQYLKTFELDSNHIEQQVYFKAQLFVPLNKTKEIFKAINNACIAGFYIQFNELQQFENCKFYIPEKLDWLIEVHPKVKWLNFEQFKSKISLFHLQKSAPLCWLKKPNGEITKFFVVWW